MSTNSQGWLKVPTTRAAVQGAIESVMSELQVPHLKCFCVKHVAGTILKKLKNDKNSGSEM